ncbi:CsgG/HfaB family protein (plasmid) [Polymorphobacter sp. PAMC 29334]|uniref:CsgG/HfaB family protein n=1 Tax=Polymorphobacter sp. PAMC 29334 TaxID=2862331 RepID=UPI001C77559D|nr:CsgG/HfaB family protein [Polymorphobacter sp. PAMC 29334]QYE37217.1 CsgG/HfaB family protein [Polymorphobacter sp. PAMC 29334]
MNRLTTALLIAAAATAATPSSAQRLGAGGTMIDDNASIPHCASPYGTVSLVETKQAATPDAGLPPQIAAYLALARSQQGGDVDPIPLLKLLVARSGCFGVLDRGEGFNAVQRERELANAGQTATRNAATITPADYVLTAQIVYANGNASGTGGGLGGLGGGFGGFGGATTRTREVQVLLAVTNVKTGVQTAIATGSARKKDINWAAAGLAGVAIGGLSGHQSTNLEKMTAAALVDGYEKLIPSMPAAQSQAAATVPAGGPVTTPTLSQRP